MLRVAVFDDHTQRRESLRMLIDATDGMTCVGAFPDCRNVVKNVVECAPRVILMDIDMPHVDGVEGVTLLRKQFKDVKILMQTVLEDNERLFASIVAGADGYLLKQTTPERLIESIREVDGGGAPMTPTIARKVLQLVGVRSSRIGVSADFHLTPREQEILGLLVDGLGYKAIATRCDISYATVNTHVTHIYQKLHVDSVVAAVKVAMQEGLV
ncbi:MAG TPA: response regulator transcription factor [Flavobacteriales bacterium]|nr:response regulator transcription factor [Flavobacteriales bacterium]HMR29230.1 response regulator transcription factor [Flavobacteriales bacterium]